MWHSLGIQSAIIVIEECERLSDRHSLIVNAAPFTITADHMAFVYKVNSRWTK